MATTKCLMYSFKGGAGRTVSLANTSYVLAREMGRGVVVLDLDVESAGSSILFGIDGAVRDGRCWTVQDVLRGYHEAAGDASEATKKGREAIVLHRADFETRLWPQMSHAVWTGDAGAGKRGFLKVIPAQIILKSSHEARATSLEALRAFEHLLDKIEDMRAAPDILLLDSSSGQQETAQMGLAYCDILIIFVRWTRQFINGTLQFLEEYICSERFCPRIRRVLVVPTAVPRSDPDGRLAEELRERRKRLEDTFFRINQAAGRDFHKPAGWVTLVDPIYECHALKWDDRIFLMEGGDYLNEADVGAALRDYRKLAKTMVDVAAELTRVTPHA